VKTKQDYDYGAKTRLWLIDKQDYGKQDYEAKPDLAFVAWAWKGKWGFCNEWWQWTDVMINLPNEIVPIGGKTKKNKKQKKDA